MHDPTHLMAADGPYCASCGQPIRPQSAYGAGPRPIMWIGLAISVLLHLLAGGYLLTHQSVVRRAPPPAPQIAMVYVAPLAERPKPKAQPEKAAQAKAPPPMPPVPPAPVRRPKAVAELRQPKPETYVPPVASPMAAPAPPAMDMQSFIAARQKRRAEAAAPQENQPPQESEAARLERIARANIAGAQGRNAGVERNDSGGVFAILNLTGHSADINFRGWNGNFKRNWSKQVPVEQGGEPDIETAIVRKMIELIRQEKPGDFVWESHRLGRQVPLSARVADTAELQAFLLKEFFPDYRRR